MGMNMVGAFGVVQKSPKAYLKSLGRQGDGGDKANFNKF